jgi:hypothetical protein
LLAHYGEQEADLWRNVRERAAMLGMTAAEVLQERLLENPEKVATKDLLAVMQGGWDYGGHKPPERSENLHVHTTKEEIEQAKNGRAEDVSVRRGPGGDDGEPDDAIEGEYTKAEGGEQVREAGAEGDSESRDAGEDSLARLLG